MIHRGEIYWAGLSEPRGTEPGYDRPLLIVQNDLFNRSRLPTVICAGLTSNLARAEYPGNLLLKASETGLSKDSVINLVQLITINKSFLREKIGTLTPQLMFAIDNGLRRAMDL